MRGTQTHTSRSIGRNAVYGFSTWILPLALSLYATPKIVGALGSEDYGIYALILGFVSYSFSFSFGRAVTKYVAEYRAAGENEKIADVISAAFFVNIIVGFVSVAIVCFSAEWLVEAVFKIDEQPQHDKTISALYLAAMIIFLAMQNQSFSSILQAIHRFDVYSKILNINNLALLMGNLVLAVYGYGFLSLLAWNSFLALASCSVYALAARRYLPEFKIKFNFRRQTLDLIVRYSAGVVGYQILANFLLLFERSWLTRHFGAESLTFYVIPMTLAIFIHSFIASLVMVIFPLASELKSEPEKLLRLYAKTTKIVCLFVFFLATTFIVEGKLFLTLWMGAEFAEKTALLLVLHTITFGFTAILVVSFQMAEGFGYPSFNFYVYIVNLIVGISLMFLLSENYGSDGVAFGRMCGFVSMFFSVFYLEKLVFGKAQTAFWLKTAGVLSVAAACAAAIEKIVVDHGGADWATFLAAAFSGAAAYSLVFWLLGFIGEDDRRLVKQLLSRR